MTSLVSERTKQSRVRTERDQMALLKERGELVHRSQVQQQELLAFAIVKQELHSLPQRMATDEKTQSKIEDEIDGVLSRLADRLETIGGKGPLARRRRRHPTAAKKHVALSAVATAPAAPASDQAAEVPAPDPDPDSKV